ncbi:MAG: glycosyltransferase [Cyanobacteria bacterium]|nr:glycosyltransferase [Cyanobacteria bacterium CG_2015-16_32_12]NCO77375.1 glycosyltransferase [Cyanobacteria bacterium CG_2015-22_32_23]NCQ05767.1 glycosyltransferase [Cyanobacteria bacterium CG_2015-09_32_10]NCQ42520.1 glycosyltransferase [Cyanobacteria bacterium CG_2015-04_32_10]NCS83908.1 glycosyltransferase [Cyanobacteria bacterium CG_2015-02_32_10]
MSNNYQFLNIVIIVNHYSNSLSNILEYINQKSNINKIIIINNSQEKKINNLCLNITKIYHKNSCKLEIIDTNKNQTSNEIYQQIIDSIEGEIIIFTKTNYYPDDHWLENLIKSFHDISINIVAGQVYKLKTENIIKKILNFIYKYIPNNNFKWVNIFDEQLANFAVRKEYMKQQKFLYLPKINQKEISFYSRILREIEAEIIYNPSAIVYHKKLKSRNFFN